MEEGLKKPRRAPVVSPLGLHRFVPIRDVRKLVWRHLTPVDRELARCAQNSARVPRLGFSETMAVVRDMPDFALRAIQDWQKPTVMRLFIGAAIDCKHYALLNAMAALTYITLDDGWSTAHKLMRYGLLQSLCTLLRDMRVCCTPPEKCAACSGFWCDLLDAAPNGTLRAQFMQFLFSKRK